MNASDDLHNAYQEWRRLANAVGDAIREGNWSLVADCQSGMQRLQPRIHRSTEAARKEWKQTGAAGAAKEKDIQALVTELIEIERRNSILLDDVRRSSQSQVRELKQAGHTLRQVQRSYAPARPSAWSSFS